MKYRTSSKRGDDPQNFDLSYVSFLLRFWLNCQIVVSDQLLLKRCNNYFQILQTGKAS